MTRVTAIAAEPFADRDEAEGWLESCRANEEERESVVKAALSVVNRAIHAHALAAADPHVREISRGHAHCTRVGFGNGAELVESRWTSALDVPPPHGRARRRELIEPEVEVARMLGGRSRVYPSEDMALRARIDLDHGRPVQAALQLDSALAALAAELESAQDTGRLSEPLARRTEVAGARDAALKRSLSEAELATLADALELLERALRRRRHGPSSGGLERR